MPDKTITIRVKEDFYKKIKIHIAEKGMSLKEYLISLIEADLSKKNLK